MKTMSLLVLTMTLISLNLVAQDKSVASMQLDMVLIESGEFKMGNSLGNSDEVPVHLVKLNSFYIGKYEVTQKDWVKLMDSNPSLHKGDNLPIENVSWNEVQVFIKKLNMNTGLNYRLPTEAEWEFAARGGNKSKGFIHCGSNNWEDVAWWCGSDEKAHIIGTKAPNELDIFDMGGNVSEWVEDWYGADSYQYHSSNNPRGLLNGKKKVIRGSMIQVLRSNNGVSISDISVAPTVSVRSKMAPDEKDSFTGFRLCLDK